MTRSRPRSAFAIVPVIDVIVSNQLGMASVGIGVPSTVATIR